MTNKETNEKVDSYLRPDEKFCDHSYPISHGYNCEHCNIDMYSGDKFVLPDYLNGNGIIKVREWLEKEGKWEEFRDFTHWCWEGKLVAKGYVFKVMHLTTNPEAFMEHFLAYMAKDK
jgi:hypothetical protein